MVSMAPRSRNPQHGLPHRTSTLRPRLMLRGHTRRVRGIVHLPGGQRIVTCSDDGSLRLWDLENGTQIGDDWRDESILEKVISIALSPNGTIIASGSDNGIVRLWDVEMGKVIAKWTGHTQCVCSVCWSRDGERVASASSDGMLRVRDAKSGGTCLEPIKTGHSWVFQVSYSPDNTKIATCGTGEGRVRIWNSKTGELLFKEYDDSDLIVVLQEIGSAPGLAWMSDGKKLIYASCSSMSRNSSGLSIMDTAARKHIAYIEGCKGTVQAISLSSNGRILASGSDDCTARLWNLDTNLQIGLPLRHEIQVQCIALSGDGKILVTACQDKIVYVWDMHTILEEAGLDSGLLSIRNWLGVYHRFRLGATVLVNRLSSLFRPS